jgi:hypothetical protein
MTAYFNFSTAVASVVLQQLKTSIMQMHGHDLSFAKGQFFTVAVFYYKQNS